MDLTTLAQANELAHQIAKADDKFQEISSNPVVIRLSSEVNGHTYPISTIGTGENCEHPDAPEATAFIEALKFKYAAQISDLTSKLDRL